MRRRVFILGGLLSFCSYFTGFSQRIELSPILIERIRYLTIFLEEMKSNKLEGVPFSYCEKVVDYFSEIELRERNLFGVQQDLSIRGANFENNFVYLNGAKVNDPQTGHFSLQIPLTEFDLEKVTIDGSSLQVAFHLKKPQREGIQLKSSWGQHSLWEEAFSINFPLKEIKNRISFEHKISSGSKQDTDFKLHNLVYYALLNEEENNWEFLFGWQKKDFGADSFYSSFYPHQEEHIDQKFFQLKTEMGIHSFSFSNNLYFRHHRDKFVLNRHDPSFYTNFHTTYVWGDEFLFKIFSGLDFLTGIFKEKITSTRLGRHSRIKKELTFRFTPQLRSNLLSQLDLSLLHCQGYGLNHSFSSRWEYSIGDASKIGLSVHRLLRYPSFTELYYFSPVNRGDTSLEEEKIYSLEFSFSHKVEKNIFTKLSIFFRKHKDAIDWVKNNLSSPWEAKNLGKLEVEGGGFTLKINPWGEKSRSIRFSYTYLHSPKASYSYSKYVFDSLQHKFVSQWKLSLFGWNLNLLGKFNKPYRRNSYVLWDLKLEKNFFSNLKFFIEGTNIFNQNYYEMVEIKGNSRWYKIGVKVNF
ncbi:MAG: hypothetical protein DRP72_02690 [Candidatus Omnitrophota bacterium]|nr:MAG: hypothetical protein DRP72_02690 [Candidatus Omnitrophota bacterium]